MVQENSPLLRNQLTKKQAEFWGLIIIICTVTALVILMIDFSIKGAIVEQALELRKAINEFGLKTGANNSAQHHISHDGALPGDLVDYGDAGVEASAAV